MASAARRAGFCAIDFGTSNSGIALPQGDGVALVPLEPGQPTMPTAVFYQVEGLAAHEAPRRHYGRGAIAAYVDGVEGRLMRSMKSVLGSSLVDQSTEVGAGHAVRYLDVVSHYLRHLKERAETAAAAPLRRVVLGRPVFFVDDDPVRDAAAQAALERAARSVGFDEVRFQYEPIAAALDHEARIDAEQIVLVADIGGGTSDFSLLRLSPAGRLRTDRRNDILASHGVHVAGTDFDRHLELSQVLPPLGYGGRGPQRADRTTREVPSRVYHDLATWHLINTVYAPARVAELRGMRDFYGDIRQHQRLMTAVQGRLGHALIARAEAAKIGLTDAAQVRIDLGAVEAGLDATLDEATAMAALEPDLARIDAAALETLRLAGWDAARVDTLYLTGGSTGLKRLAARLSALMPGARRVQGDRFASVAQGLGLYARRLFGQRS
ncbi:MAG: Hsp70 family protein [Aquabacterium sp.]